MKGFFHSIKTWLTSRPYIVLAVVIGGFALLLALQPDVRIIEKPDVRMGLPDTLGPWTGEDVRYCLKRDCLAQVVGAQLATNMLCQKCGAPMSDKSLAELEGLPKDTTIVRKVYRSEHHSPFVVAIVLTGADRESIHRPERCLVAQGSQILRKKVEDIPIKGRPPLRIMVMNLLRHYQRPGDENVTLTHSFFAYWFMGQGCQTPYHLERMFKLGWDRIFNNVAHRWAYISIGGTMEEGSTKHLDELRTFLNLLYPELLSTPARQNILSDFN